MSAPRRDPLLFAPEHTGLALKLRKAMPHFEASRDGKPSKRDRREIDRLRRRV